MISARYIVLSLLATAFLTTCSEEKVEPDTTVKTYELANDLFESTYSYISSSARFSYTDGRVTDVSLVNQKGEASPYLTVNYLDDDPLRVRSVYYHDESHLSDTLLYDGKNLVQIKSTYQDEHDEDITYTRDIYFTYNEYGQVIEAKNDARRVEFQEFKKGNCTRVKYFEPGLRTELFLEYDDKPTPFVKLGYLNLVLFANNDMNGIGYMVNNNVVSSVEDEYENAVRTQQYKVEYTYDTKGRPTVAVRKRVSKDDTYTDFFTYN